MARVLQSINEWHNRFKQQTRWTQALAAYILQRANISSTHHILEVGCGTGAVLEQFIQPLGASYCGLDINPDYLSFFASFHPGARLVLGDAHQLPFSDNSFDVSLCHYLLLWVSDPSQVLHEMLRVTHPGGMVMALAEPDYGGRIDYPAELSLLGKWQMDSLAIQGADASMGRKLRALFTQCGFTSVEAGVIGGQWRQGFDQSEFESEWEILHNDLSNQPEKLAQLPRFQDSDRRARQQGERILFVPTFYAWGYAP